MAHPLGRRIQPTISKLAACRSLRPAYLVITTTTASWTRRTTSFGEKEVRCRMKSTRREPSMPPTTPPGVPDSAIRPALAEVPYHPRFQNPACLRCCLWPSVHYALVAAAAYCALAVAVENRD